jgi:hypothetical protein
MLWCFTRGAAQIDVEVHRRAAGGGYTLEVTYPDGTERIEHFEEPAKLVTRTLAVQQKLIADGWMPMSPVGGRALAPKRVRWTRRARYAYLARKAAAQFHRSVTRRLAAAFGL